MQHSSHKAILRTHETLPFIGRSRELDVFVEASERLLDGQGGLMMLAGQPGIGKTQTARRFSKIAYDRGILAVWGLCREQAGMPPYWPWSQILRALISEQSQSMGALSGEDQTLLATIVPELAPDPGLADHKMSELTALESRFPIYDAVFRFLAGCAKQQPLLLVLDNLHLADTPSLNILEFVAAELESAGILLIGTYRDVELSRKHPLSEALRRLVGHSGYQRVRLAGLSQAEIADLAKSLSGHHLPDSLIAALYDQTEGNPFYAGEVIRYLMDCGYLADGASLPHSVLVPEGVREAIGQRLDRLTPCCNELIRHAAVLGRDFVLAELVDICRQYDSDQLDMLLDEALMARIIEADPTQPGLFHFSHALIRETVYDETPLTQRIRLHASAADVIESAGRVVTPDDLGRLAHHYFQAQMIAGSDKVVTYAQQAAEHAAGIQAHEDAARYFSLAIDCLEMNAVTISEQSCRLRLQLSESQRCGGDVYAAMDSARSAAIEAETLGLNRLFAEAALAGERARFGPGLPGHESAELLSRAIIMLGEEDPGLRARLLSARAQALSFTENEDEIPMLVAESIEIARTLDDKLNLCRALHDCWVALRRHRDFHEQRLSYNREQLQLAIELDDMDLVAESRATLRAELLEIGEMGEFDRNFEAYRQLIVQLRQPHHAYQVEFVCTMRALLTGQLDRVSAMAQRALKKGSRIPGSDADGLYAMQMFALYRELGRLEEIKPLLMTLLDGNDAGSFWRPGLALIHAELGDLEAAGAILSEIVGGGFRRLPRDELWLTSLAFLTDVCAMVRDSSVADALIEQLMPFRGRNIVLSAAVLCLGPVDRLLGRLNGLCGHWDDAEAYFESAARMSERICSLPFQLHVRCDRAEVLIMQSGAKSARQASILLKDLSSDAEKRGLRPLKTRADALMAGHAIGVVGSVGEALTGREIEVLRLIADGLSNRQIADRLYLSMSTVATHVRNILAKTETTNRTAAVAHARAQRLVV
ncbi:MAG: AAA family ATPase [Pseudomonadota bacterium]